MDREMRTEIYLSLLLLGADEMLLAALATSRDRADDKDVLTDLRNWNDAKVLEMKEWLSTMTGSELEAVQARIGQYEQTREGFRKAA
jgi:hypothetical protein